MQTSAPVSVAAQVLHVVDSHGDGDEDVGTGHHRRTGDEVGHARGVGSAASQHFPCDRAPTSSVEQVCKAAGHRVTVLAHPDPRSD